PPRPRGGRCGSRRPWAAHPRRAQTGPPPRAPSRWQRVPPYSHLTVRAGFSLADRAVRSVQQLERLVAHRRQAVLAPGPPERLEDLGRMAALEQQEEAVAVLADQR